MNIKIIQIPAGCGKDADECLKKDPAVWFKAVAEAKEVMEWYFAGVLAGADKRDPKQKQKIADTLLTEIIRLPYAVERDHWLKKLAEEIGVDRDTLAEEMRRLALTRPKLREVGSKTAAFGQDKKTEAIAKKASWGEPGRIGLLVENILALFLKFPQFWPDYAPHLKDEFFALTPYAGLYESLKRGYNKSLNIEAIRNELDKENQNSIDILLLKADKDFSDFNAETASKEIGILLAGIKMERQKNRRQELNVKLKEAEKEKKLDLVQSILQEIMELEK